METDLETFVGRWWRAPNLTAFCQLMAMAMDRRQASGIAASLRRHGVDLKWMPRESPPVFKPRIAPQLARLKEVAKRAREIYEALPEPEPRMKT